jgi:hypothetical protein
VFMIAITGLKTKATFCGVLPILGLFFLSWVLCKGASLKKVCKFSVCYLV